jgi:frataxin-like iron-binding protein CyaY
MAAAYAKATFANGARGKFKEITVMFRLNTVMRNTLAAGLALTVALGAGAGIASAEEDAKVAVVLRPIESTATTITTEVVAINYGDERVRRVEIDLPYDTSRLQLISANSPDQELWLASTSNGTLSFETLNLSGNDSTAESTLTFAVLPGVASGTAITSQASFDAGSQEGVSNRLTQVVGQGWWGGLNVNSNGTVVTASSEAIFAPSEPVFAWVSTADGRHIPIVYVDGVGRLESALPVDQNNDDEEDSDPAEFVLAPNGAATISILRSDLPAGEHTLVFRGYWTGLSANSALVIR